MRSRNLFLGMAASTLLTVALSLPVQAQYVVAAPPAVTYYYAPAPTVAYYPPAPVTYYYTAAPSVAYYQTPVVTAPAPVPTTAYYVAPAPVATTAYYAAPAPAVSYYPASTVVYPARVSTGLFGRTTVTTPYYKIKY